MKYRKVLLNEGVVVFVVDTTARISERYDIEMEEVGYDKNRIHLLRLVHLKIPPGQVVRVFKRTLQYEKSSVESRG